MMELGELWFFAALLLVFYMAMACLRLISGPTAPDRAVALDTINTWVVATLILLGVGYRQIIFIDVAIVYAVLSFVSTLFIARYIGGEL